MKDNLYTLLPSSMMKCDILLWPAFAVDLKASLNQCNPKYYIIILDASTAYKMWLQ